MVSVLVMACAPTSAESETSVVVPGELSAQHAPSDHRVWICGNGRIDAGETCDDANRDIGDGCAGCELEVGFVCDDQTPSRCEPTCGDGLVLGAESCDDGNTIPGDGCLACEIEPGYRCDAVQGASVCSPVCGDGIILARAGEACDDGNVHPGDGCSPGCAPEPGSCCDPAAGYCMQRSSFEVLDASVDVLDGTYDGSWESMSCVEIDLAAPGICNFGYVADVRVELAIEHPRVGELTIKMMAPNGRTTTLLSVPGFDEHIDGAPEEPGSWAALSALGPLLFDEIEQDAVDAELMGAGLGLGQTVCLGDGRCSFVPNPGAGEGEHGLADFHDVPAAGSWRVCVGDAWRSLDVPLGKIDAVRLTYRAR